MKTIKIMFLCVIVSLIMLSSKAKAEAPNIPPTAKDYIVEFAEKYNTDPNVLLRVGSCESKLNHDTISDGGRSKGIFQFQEPTFLWMEKEFGENLNYDSSYDQIKLAAWAFSKGYGSNWTAYRAIKNGGVYSFYSKQLQKHFTVYCKL